MLAALEALVVGDLGVKLRHDDFTMEMRPVPIEFSVQGLLQLRPELNNPPERSLQLTSRTTANVIHKLAVRTSKSDDVVSEALRSRITKVSTGEQRP